MADKLNSQSWTSFQTATGWDARRPDSFFVRDAGSRCLVRNNSKCGSDKLWRSLVSRVDQECFGNSWSSGRVAADMAKVVKPRVRVDATASKAIASRRGMVRAVARREPTIAKVLGCDTNA